MEVTIVLKLRKSVLAIIITASNVHFKSFAGVCVAARSYGFLLHGLCEFVSLEPALGGGGRVVRAVRLELEAVREVNFGQLT